MRYLITHPSHKPFYSASFNPWLDFKKDMVVFDLFMFSYTTDGVTWELTVID